MFGYWLNLRVRKPSPLPGLAVSMVAHGILLVGWIIATLPGQGISDDSLSNGSYALKRAFYLPPPDKLPPGKGTADQKDNVAYLSVDMLRPHGLGTDIAKQKVLKPKDLPPLESLPVKFEMPRMQPTHDSVFTELEVDLPARVTNSAAPEYPLTLLKKNIEGRVTARWVIDTTGHADTSSFEVLNATRPEFAAALRAALPRMRFEPARIGSAPVRQMVEQTISFKVQQPAAPIPTPTKPSE